MTHQADFTPEVHKTKYNDADTDTDTDVNRVELVRTIARLLDLETQELKRVDNRRAVLNENISVLLRLINKYDPMGPIK